MYLEKYTEFERLQFYVRRKSIFPSASNKAFESVFEKYFNDLTSFSSTHNVEDYMAAVNETFMVVIEQVENGKVIENLETYIQAVFKRVMRKIIDSNKTGISIDEYKGFFIEMSDYESFESLKYSDVNVLDLLNSVLTNKTEIEVMRLTSMGYSLKEVASLLDKKPDSIIGIRKRALSKLKESIKKPN